MSCRVTFAYRRGAKVRIVELDRPGFVEALRLNGDGAQYYVVYWYEGDRRGEWLYDWEIAGA